MRKRSACDHAEHGDRGVAVAFAGKDQLPERAAAEEHRAPADEHHAERVPKMAAVGDGLHRKTKLELAKRKVADEHYDEDRNEAVEQFEILEHDAVTDAADHAEAGALRKRTDHKRDRKGDQHGRMHGARAGFAGLKERGNRDGKDQEPNHQRGQDAAFRLFKRVVAAKREAALDEPRADEDTEHEADQTHERVQVAAAEADDHAQRAAEERERADHHKCTEHEARCRRGARLCAELTLHKRHNESAQHEADDLRPDVLHLCSAVHPNAACDVAQEAGNAEAHVRRVAKQRQHDCRDAYDSTRDHNDPIYLFHFSLPIIPNFDIWHAQSAPFLRKL